RFDRGWPCLLPALLPLVQPRAPPLRVGLPHPGRRSLPTRWCCATRACARSPGRLRRSPRTLRPPAPAPTAATGTGLDKQTAGGHASAIIGPTAGLTKVDSFRTCCRLVCTIDEPR